VSAGGAGRYGIALHVLLSRRQSQKVAYGKEIPGGGKSTSCPAKAQKTSSHIAAAAVEILIVNIAL